RRFWAARERCVWKRQSARKRTRVDDAAAGGVEQLRRGLRSGDEAEHIQIEMLVELRLCDALERREFVDARVGHQDVEPAKRFLRFSEQSFNVCLLSNIRLNRDGF